MVRKVTSGFLVQGSTSKYVASHGIEHYVSLVDLLGYIWDGERSSKGNKDEAGIRCIVIKIHGGFPPLAEFGNRDALD